MKKQTCIYLLIALLLAVFTVACIKWPQKSKLLGDEYECHIYSQDKFFQFYPLEYNGQILFKRGLDSLFDCEWDFIYNDEAKAYEISTSYGDYGQLFITLDDNNEILLTDVCDDNSDRWNIIKVDNSVFYIIVNAANSDYAIRFEEGDARDCGSAAILDRDNFEFWMRLQ